MYPYITNINIQTTRLAERWDYLKTRKRLEELNFAEINHADVNQTYEKFSHLLLSSCVKQNASSRRARYFSIPICPWMTDAILIANKQKEHWHNKLKQNRDSDYYRARYKTARNLSLSLMRKRKKEYYNTLIIKAKGNSKEIWRIVNSVIKPTEQCSILPDSNALGTTEADLAESFNDYFVNMGTTTQCNQGAHDTEFVSFLPPPQINTFVFSEITTAEIIDTVKIMPSNKATGHDNLPVSLLKNNIDILGPVLANLFNESVLSGTYPDQLKIGRVVAIYKADNPNDLANYRPITILSCINTLFEKLIAKRVTSYLEKYRILSNAQHGFRTGYSVTTAVSSLTEIINQALNKNYFALGVFLDIRKAFDSVDHSILLRKLEHYGFRGQVLGFFRSYLTNRKQYVVVRGKESSLKTVKTGVPQGSVLGPILFSLFINDYPRSLRFSNSILYADDTALIIPRQSLQEAEEIAQSELQNTLAWFETNKLILNSKKTKYVVFASNRKTIPTKCNLYLGNTQIQQISSYKYLGITLDSSLHWAPHIEQVTKKIVFGCYTILKARKHFHPQTLRLIYFSIFHCHLTYCIESWGFTYASYIDPLIKIQKRAVRIIASATKDAPSAQLFAQLNIMPLIQARDYNTAILIHRILTTNKPDLSSIFIRPTRDTRQAEHNKFNLPKAHNVYGQRSLSFVGAKIWNEIPSLIRKLPNAIPSLKHHFKACI